jgi:alpha/beta superfamily hydrolase
MDDAKQHLLYQAQALADQHRQAKLAEMEERAAREHADQQRRRLFAFINGPAEGESTVGFAPLDAAGEPATHCGATCNGLLADRSTQLAAVVCHPWGPLGGSLRDVCVSKVVAMLSDAGITTLRFDFRTGIGRGHAAADDVRGACALLRSLDAPPRRLLLVGYSYGACVVADVADAIPDVAAFAMLAPPLGATVPLFLCREVTRSAQASAKPKLVMVGEADQFCSEQRFRVFAQAMAPPKRAHVVTDGASQQCCSRESGCGHAHAKRVHHFNLFEYLDEYFRPWVAETFGVPFGELGTSSGDVALKSI